MDVSTRIKKFGKNVLIGGTLLGAFLFGAKANAGDIEKPKEQTPSVKAIDAFVEKEAKKLPKRKLAIDFFTVTPLDDSDANALTPLDNFDANAKAWYSINQVLGKGSDLLERELNLDNDIFGRLGQVAVLSYLNYMTEYYSHELAHSYETIKSGWSPKARLNWSDWRVGFPKYEAETAVEIFYNLFPDKYSKSKEPEKRYARTITSGLNQDELNAYAVHKNSVLKRNLTFDEAFSFLITKNLDEGYILFGTKGGLNYKADYKPINYLEATFSQSIRNRGLWNDIDMYLHHLHRKGLYRAQEDDYYNLFMEWNENTNFKGIELTKKELLLQAMIADMFSAKTYDGIMSIYNYLVKGKRSTKPVTINLGRTEITPPLIIHYLTKDGSFYNTNAFVNIAGKMLLEANLGTDVDFIGHGKVRHLRTGGQLHTMNNGISFRPFLYLNSTRGRIFAYTGVSAGIEITLGVPDTLEVIVKLGFNENDIVENDIKGKNNGLEVNAGLNITY